MHSVLAVLTLPEECGNVDALMEPYGSEYEVEPYIDRPHEEILRDLRNAIGFSLIRDETPDFEERFGIDINKALLGQYTDEELFEHATSTYYDGEEFNECGDLISTYNPDAMWDWWVVGGRWADKILLKDGTFCDRAYCRDIDFKHLGKMTPEQYAMHKRWWDYFINGNSSAPISAEEKDRFDTFWCGGKGKKKEAWLKEHGYPSFEEWIASLEVFTTAGFLSTETGWVEVDDDPEGFQEFLKTAEANPDAMLTIVDYHM